eukprot:COSAG01_NODE_61716_length_288_cov_0.814815_1_plen_28_part_10
MARATMRAVATMKWFHSHGTVVVVAAVV